MNYNFHTHTFFSNHAEGTMEEYVKKAIDGGIKHMGFSEHVPFAFPDGHESWYRLQIEKVEIYLSEIYALREKYKDIIDIKIGYEMEYYPMYFDEMLCNAKKFGAEYLILGQHFINQTEGSHDGLHTGKKNTCDADLSEYVNCVVSAIKSGVFSYIAHPDMFNYSENINLYNEEMRKICIASREHNIPLEINFLGIRDNRQYPDSRFWELAGEEKSPVTFGFDAHDVESACDRKSLEMAKTIVEKYKLNYIGEPKLISL